MFDAARASAPVADIKVNAAKTTHSCRHSLNVIGVGPLCACAEDCTGSSKELL